MTRHVLSALAAILPLAVLLPDAAAVAQAPSAFGPRLARAAEGFTNIFDVAELPDGRVLMTDSRERQVAVLDLVAGTVQRVGTRGQGPREYLSAFTILPRPDGTFGVYDANQRRFTIVSAAGEITGTEALRPPAFGGFSAPRGPDAEGRVYVDSRRVDDSGLLRVAPIYRWNLASGDVDSVAAAMQYARGQEGPGITPMPRGDAWAFLPDGSVALVVGDDYHVEWVGGARGAVTGPPIPHRRVGVGEAERRAWVAEMLAQPPAGAAVSPSPSAAPEPGSREVSEQLARIDESRFPEDAPAFAMGWAPASPRGHVWLKLEVESTAERTVFDLIDREGRLAHRLAVQGDARVVGFGESVVYLARRDALGLDWLERYRYP